MNSLQRYHNARYLLGHVCVYTSELNKNDMYPNGNTNKSAEIKII